jgi:hypothetical protein
MLDELRLENEQLSYQVLQFKERVAILNEHKKAYMTCLCDAAEGRNKFRRQTIEQRVQLSAQHAQLASLRSQTAAKQQLIEQKAVIDPMFKL